MRNRFSMLRCGVKVTTALFIGLMVYQLMAVTWNRLTHPHYKNKPAAKEMRKAMRKRLQKMGVLEEFEKYQARSNNGGGWVLIGCAAVQAMSKANASVLHWDHKELLLLCRDLLGDKAFGKAHAKSSWLGNKLYTTLFADQTFSAMILNREEMLGAGWRWITFLCLSGLVHYLHEDIDAAEKNVDLIFDVILSHPKLYDTQVALNVVDIEAMCEGQAAEIVKRLDMEEELESTDLSAPEPPKEITLETMGFFNDAGKGPPSPIKWTKAEPMEPEVPHLQLQQNLPAIGNMSALARILQEHREAADEQAAYEAINDTLTKMQVFDPMQILKEGGV